MLLPTHVFQAIRCVADDLSAGGHTRPLRLVVAGSMAGILGGELPPDRVTADVDLMWLDAPADWALVEAAAKRVESAHNLPPRWLNRDCTVFSSNLPLGWRERCVEVLTCPPLTLVRISRFDLIGMKLISAPRRARDRDDLRSLNPTREELERLAAHLDRVDAEDLRGRDFSAQMKLLRELLGAFQ
jgi:hypothetical protein